MGLNPVTQLPTSPWELGVHPLAGRHDVLQAGQRVLCKSHHWSGTRKSSGSSHCHCHWDFVSLERFCPDLGGRCISVSVSFMLKGA